MGGKLLAGIKRECQLFSTNSKSNMATVELTVSMPFMMSTIEMKYKARKMKISQALSTTIKSEGKKLNENTKLFHNT